MEVFGLRVNLPRSAYSPIPHVFQCIVEHIEALWTPLNLTRKRIKQIRNLQNLTSWAKYFEYEDLDALRQKIINELIFTNKTLEEIKREIHEQE